MDVAGWRAWYENRIFHSQDTRWEDLPGEGCLGAVVFYEPPYTDIVRDGDWFYKEDGTVKTTDSTREGWVEKPDQPDELVKRGVEIDDDEWERVYNEMHHACR